MRQMHGSLIYGKRLEVEHVAIDKWVGDQPFGASSGERGTCPALLCNGQPSGGTILALRMPKIADSRPAWSCRRPPCRGPSSAAAALCPSSAAQEMKHKLPRRHLHAARLREELLTKE